MGSSGFEPRIVGFLCNWCSYPGADMAGAARMQFPPNVHIVRVNCSGRVDPSFVLKAFREGADGVLVAGCHPGDCHYTSGNYKTMRRMPLLERLLSDLGIEPARFRLEWVSAAEGGRWARLVSDMTEQVRRLGPLDWNAPSAAAGVPHALPAERAGVTQSRRREDSMCFVRDVLRTKPPEVWMIGPRDMAFRALELMAEKNLGALPVVDHGELVGMFSERDYARKVILKGKSSHATPVSDLMSTPVTYVHADDTVETCVQLMTERHIRHLPVLEAGRLIGIVSIGDVLKATIRDQKVLIQDLQNYIVGARS